MDARSTRTYAHWLQHEKAEADRAEQTPDSAFERPRASVPASAPLIECLGLHSLLQVGVYCREHGWV